MIRLITVGIHFIMRSEQVKIKERSRRLEKGRRSHKYQEDSSATSFTIGAHPADSTSSLIGLLYGGDAEVSRARRRLDRPLHEAGHGISATHVSCDLLADAFWIMNLLTRLQHFIS
jgi:hypothetical protein